MRLLEEEVLPAFSESHRRARVALWHLRAMAAQKALSSRVHRACIAYERWSGATNGRLRSRGLGRPSGRGAPDDFADVPGEPFGAAD